MRDFSVLTCIWYSVGFKIDCCLNLDNDDAVELDDELLIELVGLQIL